MVERLAPHQAVFQDAAEIERDEQGDGHRQHALQHEQERNPVPTDGETDVVHHRQHLMGEASEVERESHQHRPGDGMFHQAQHAAGYEHIAQQLGGQAHQGEGEEQRNGDVEQGRCKPGLQQRLGG